MAMDRLKMSDQQWLSMVGNDPEFQRLLNAHTSGQHLVNYNGRDVAASFAINEHLKKIGLPENKSFTMADGQPALKDRTQGWTIPLAAAIAAGTLGVGALAAAGALGASGAAGGAGATTAATGAGVGAGTGVGAGVTTLGAIPASAMASAPLAPAVAPLIAAQTAGAVAPTVAAGTGAGLSAGTMANYAAKLAPMVMSAASRRGGSGEQDDLLSSLTNDSRRLFSQNLGRQQQLNPLYDAVVRMVAGQLPKWSGLDLSALLQAQQPPAAPRRSLTMAGNRLGVA